jgi:hypothetical protein
MPYLQIFELLVGVHGLYDLPEGPFTMPALLPRMPQGTGAALGGFKPALGDFGLHFQSCNRAIFRYL